jgi:hypothetical protein
VTHITFESVNRLQNRLCENKNINSCDFYWKISIDKTFIWRVNHSLIIYHFYSYSIDSRTKYVICQHTTINDWKREEKSFRVQKIIDKWVINVIFISWCSSRAPRPVINAFWLRFILTWHLTIKSNFSFACTIYIINNRKELREIFQLYETWK